MRHILKGLSVMLCLTGLAHAAESSEQDVKTSSSPWSTSAHLGYAVETKGRSFENSGGSLALLTIQHQLHRRFSLGWHTLGSGATSDNERFYRLASGPLAAVHPFKNTDLFVLVGNFSESARQAHDRSLLYRAKGQHLTIGWQRHHQLNPRFWLTWSALFGNYHGNIAEALPAAIVANGAKHRAANRAVTIALRFVL